MRSLILGFLSAFVLLFMVSACGSGDAGPTATNVSNANTIDALELFRTSVRHQNELRSFRASLSMEVDASGQIVPMRIEMEVGEDQSIHMVMDIEVEGGETIEVTMIPPYMYTLIPGQGWVRMSMEALANASELPIELVMDPLNFQQSLFPNQADGITSDIYEVASLGRQTIDGVETEHLTIQMDYAKLFETLGEDEISQLAVLHGHRSGIPIGEVQELMAQTEINGFEAWIDDQGRTRQMVLEMKMGDSATKIDMRMRDFDEAITVSAPEEFVHFDP